MGDEADARIDYLINGMDFDRWKRAHTVKYVFGPHWRQTEFHTPKEGIQVRLEDMTPKHRGNTIRLFERRVRNLPGVTVEELHAQPLIKRMEELGIE